MGNGPFLWQGQRGAPDAEQEERAGGKLGLSSTGGQSRREFQQINSVKYIQQKENKD